MMEQLSVEWPIDMFGGLVISIDMFGLVISLGILLLAVCAIWLRPS